jgi:hypothetical protein
MQIGFGKLHSAMIRKGYAFFTEGDYNLNLIGIRSRDGNSNRFNDVLCVAFYTAGSHHLFVFDATTDPGLYWRENLANVNGTAIVKPGQYPGLWKLGQHQGKYSALVQNRPITVYRDADRDRELDLNAATETGLFGINCHRASPTGMSREVSRWSAGCQVLASVTDFQILMALCQKASSMYGNGFTYTLLTEQELLL